MLKSIAHELSDGAKLFFSIALGIGAGYLVRLLLGARDSGWRMALVIVSGLAVMVITGALMHAYP